MEDAYRSRLRSADAARTGLRRTETVNDGACGFLLYATKGMSMNHKSVRREIRTVLRTRAPAPASTAVVVCAAVVVSTLAVVDVPIAPVAVGPRSVFGPRNRATTRAYHRRWIVRRCCAVRR